MVLFRRKKKGFPSIEIRGEEEKKGAWRVGEKRKFKRGGMGFAVTAERQGKKISLAAYPTGETREGRM